MSSRRLKSTFAGAGIDGDGAFLCKCGYAMKDFRVSKKKSPYRGDQYWACRKHSKDDSRCNTWVWFHELDQVKQLIPPAKIAPRTPQKQRDIRLYGQLTPPSTTSSLKRKMEQVSFDSTLGGMSDDEPGPSSPSRSPRKKRGVDAATQTPDTRLRSPARSGNETDTAGTVQRRDTLRESPSPPSRVQRPNSTPVTPQRPERRGGLFARSNDESPKNPRARDQLGAPSLGNRIPQPNFGRTIQDRENEDSDLESYGWNDELYTEVLHIADKADKPQG